MKEPQRYIFFGELDGLGEIFVLLCRFENIVFLRKLW